MDSIRQTWPNCDAVFVRGAGTCKNSTHATRERGGTRTGGLSRTSQVPKNIKELVSIVHRSSRNGNQENRFPSRATLTRFRCLRQLEAHLVDRETDDAHEVDGAWAHGTVGVDAVDPAHRLNEPKAPADAFAFCDELSGFGGREGCGELVVWSADDESFLEELQSQVCVPVNTKSGRPSRYRCLSFTIQVSESVIGASVD